MIRILGEDEFINSIGEAVALAEFRGENVKIECPAGRFVAKPCGAVLPLGLVSGVEPMPTGLGRPVTAADVFQSAGREEEWGDRA